MARSYCGGARVAEPLGGRGSWREGGAAVLEGDRSRGALAHVVMALGLRGATRGLSIRVPLLARGRSPRSPDPAVLPLARARYTLSLPIKPHTKSIQTGRLYATKEDLSARGGEDPNCRAGSTKTPEKTSYRFRALRRNATRMCLLWRGYIPVSCY